MPSTKELIAALTLAGLLFGGFFALEVRHVSAESYAKSIEQINNKMASQELDRIVDQLNYLDSKELDDQLTNADKLQKKHLERRLDQMMKP